FFFQAFRDAINEGGAIVGYSGWHDCYGWVFIVQNGVSRVMPLPGLPYRGPIAINDAGAIAGTAIPATQQCWPPGGGPKSAYVLEADGDYTVLPPLARRSDSYRGAINKRGQVGGSAITASGESHAVIWEPRGGGDR